MEKGPQIHHSRVKLGSQGFENRVRMRRAFWGIYNAPLSHDDGCAIIKEAFNRGITFFDTADIYGDKHDNEIMLGKALKQLPRDKVQVATKFGFVYSESNGRPLIEVKGTPRHVRACCEASLKRLDVDYIDLYFQHRVDTSVPIEETVKYQEIFFAFEMILNRIPNRTETFRLIGQLIVNYCFTLLHVKMGELKKLVEEGKIKYIGLSEPSIDTLKRAHKVHPITALQMEYSLWTREIEDEILPLCRELGIGIVAYSPLGRGFFGGKAVVETMPNDSLLANYPRFHGENLEKNKLIYTRVSDLAMKHGCTVPQLVLGWLLHQGDDIVPIPGTTKVKNIINNVGSLALKLSEEAMKEICDAVPLDEVSGKREMGILSEFTWKFANTPLK
ncbi:hypothetical protein V6N13_047495 [Hibiscus sabdariffa]